MPTDIVTIFEANWDDTIIAHENIYLETFFPAAMLSKGITFELTSLGFDQLGLSLEVIGDNVGDVYILRVKDITQADINKRVKAVIDVCQNYKGTPNVSDYVRFRFEERNALPYIGQYLIDRTVSGVILALRTGETATA